MANLPAAQIVVCPYCSAPAELTDGKRIYPHRPDLWEKLIWACTPCDAYVGCHPGTSEPLGRLSDAELRREKIAAHAVFDPMWRARRMSRKKAYTWLGKQLGIPFEQTHIGMFDVEMCRRVVAVCQARKDK